MRQRLPFFDLKYGTSDGWKPKCLATQEVLSIGSQINEWRENALIFDDFKTLIQTPLNGPPSTYPFWALCTDSYFLTYPRLQEHETDVTLDMIFDTFHKLEHLNFIAISLKLHQGYGYYAQVLLAYDRIIQPMVYDCHLRVPRKPTETNKSRKMKRKGIFQPSWKFKDCLQYLKKGGLYMMYTKTDGNWYCRETSINQNSIPHLHTHSNLQYIQSITCINRWATYAAEQHQKVGGYVSSAPLFLLYAKQSCNHEQSLQKWCNQFEAALK